MLTQSEAAFARATSHTQDTKKVKKAVQCYDSCHFKCHFDSAVVLCFVSRVNQLEASDYTTGMFQSLVANTGFCFGHP